MTPGTNCTGARFAAETGIPYPHLAAGVSVLRT